VVSAVGEVVAFGAVDAVYARVVCSDVSAEDGGERDVGDVAEAGVERVCDYVAAAGWASCKARCGYAGG